MSNLGMHRNLTSAQLANEVDATAKQALDDQMADVDGIGKKQKAGKKDEDAAFNGAVPFIPEEKEDKEKSQDDNSTQDESQEEVDEAEEDEEADLPYTFRCNQSDMIEIVDTDGKILRTISPEDAANVSLKVSKMPGVFINKKV